MFDQPICEKQDRAHDVVFLHASHIEVPHLYIEMSKARIIVHSFLLRRRRSKGGVFLQILQQRLTAEQHMLVFQKMPSPSLGNAGFGCGIQT